MCTSLYDIQLLSCEELSFQLTYIPYCRNIATKDAMSSDFAKYADAKF